MRVNRRTHGRAATTKAVDEANLIFVFCVFCVFVCMCIYLFHTKCFLIFHFRVSLFFIRPVGRGSFIIIIIIIIIITIIFGKAEARLSS